MRISDWSSDVCSSDLQTIARNLSEVEAMSLAALEAGIDWSFESFADYLGLLRRKSSYPNVAAFVGHSTVRSVLMAAAASELAPSEVRLAANRTRVRQGMERRAHR